MGTSPGTGAIVSLGYGYNALGQVTGRSNPNQGLQQDFLYDDLGRITQATLYR